MHTFDTLDKLPRRLAQVLDSTSTPIGPRNSSVVLVGTGQAASAATLFQTVTANSSAVPVIVCRDRKLPAFVDSSTLVVALSETGSDPVSVDAVSHATDLKATVAVVAPGGHLLDMAESQGYIVRAVPKPIVPGVSMLAELFFGLWGLLAGSAALPDNSDANARAAVDLLVRQRKVFGPEAAEDSNPARLLTGAFYRRQALLYGTTPLARAAVDVWVDRLHATGHPAYAGDLDTDANIERWPATTLAQSPNAEALVLRDVDEPAAVHAQIDALRKSLGASITVNELSMDGRTPLERLWGAIYLAEWTAFYLAP